jgi:hypothetical protein
LICSNTLGDDLAVGGDAIQDAGLLEFAPAFSPLGLMPTSFAGGYGLTAISGKESLERRSLATKV